MNQKLTTMYLRLNYELIINELQVNHGWIMNELLSHGWTSLRQAKIGTYHLPRSIILPKQVGGKQARLGSQDT